VGRPSSDNIEDIYPLAPMQQGLLFHDLLSSGPERPYIQQVLWRMDGRADLADLRQAWEHVVARHPIFRTFVICESRSEPIQVVCREAALPWCDLDWSDLAPAEVASELDAFLRADRANGFRLNRAPLMRLTAIRLPDGSAQIVWTFHHLLIDGWCLSLIFSEVLAACEALRQGRPLPAAAGIPYRRFIDWLAGRDEARDRAYWTNLLAGIGGPTSIPGTPPSGAGVVRGVAVRHLSRVDSEAMQKLCAREKLTAGVIVQAAWAILLSTFSGDEDVVFGLTVAGRPPGLPDAERIAGLFINSVPVRLKLDGAAPVRHLLRAAMEQQAEREDHLHAPLAQIKSWIGLAGDASLFDSLVVIENYPMDRVVAAAAARLGISDLRTIEATSFPLTLIATPGETLELKLLHDDGRLSGPDADRLLQTLACLISGVAGDCGRALSGLPLVAADERDWLLAAGRGADREWRRPELLHRLVEEQVARDPDTIAVRYHGRDLTFRELDGRANQLAHRLQQFGVGPDRIVGIAMQRSIEMIVGLFGILKAGGAFLPIDPGLPSDRLAFMVSDADVPVLLVHAPVAGGLPPHGARTICLDPDWTAIADQPTSPPRNVDVGPDHLAYVIYTSGSTGAPKGAMNTHRAICNRLLWMQEAYGLCADDRVLQKTPCSFDVSVWEYFWPLLTGARLVVAEPGGHHDPAYLASVIDREQITTVHFVPSMLQMFLEQEGLGASCASLRRTIVSGEALLPALADRFFGRLPGELHNLYGPAEAAVDVTFWQCHPGAAVPIGRPIANLRIYLLDAFGRLVPRGMPGELSIGGVGVGRGYHNRPDLTADKFIDSPMAGAPDSRLYRTGDLARWREDGALEFLGRRDGQVKLRGMRIELGEIEAVLRAVPGIADAAAVLERGVAGQDRIVAYVTISTGASITSADVLDSVRARLPASMMPSRLICLDRLPLSPNGKLDRKALAALAPTEPTAGPPLLPQTTLERAIADVWRDVLRLERVGLRDSFFELGGTSLLIIPVHARLRDAFDPTLGLVELLQYPTIETLARRLSRVAPASQTAAEDQRATGPERARRLRGLHARRQGTMRRHQPR
jgi:amino acid adenylation domain-containing protein